MGRKEVPRSDAERRAISEGLRRRHAADKKAKEDKRNELARAAKAKIDAKKNKT